MLITKKHLQNLQEWLPVNFLYQIQDIHSKLLFKWILSSRCEPFSCSQKSAMVFSPHQDDETFGCGGMIALKRQQGTSVAVTFLTDGQGAGGNEGDSKAQIINTRKQEAKTALGILGVDESKIHFLEKPDGTLQELKKDQREKTIDQLVQLLITYQPEEVYVPHRKDCHRDHEATYQLVKEAVEQANIQVELLQYPIWLFWRAPLFIMLKLQDIAAAYQLSIVEVQEKKSQAIASYHSQLDGLPPGFVKRFLSSYEIFFKAES
jgi:N-acetylglucosamine malate deacetylase 1